MLEMSFCLLLRNVNTILMATYSVKDTEELPHKLEAELHSLCKSMVKASSHWNVSKNKSAYILLPANIWACACTASVLGLSLQDMQHILFIKEKALAGKSCG